MNRYSKIKLGNTSKSRSMDFSDLQYLPEKKPIDTLKPQETKQVKSASDVEDNLHGRCNKDVFGLMLSRNSSVSSTSSHRFRLDKQTPTGPTTTSLHSAVKRAFSMRRSSSVSERYCRIHDQCVTQASPSPLDDDDDDDEFVEGMGYNAVQKTRSVKNKNARNGSGKILKACKRFFGL